MFIIELSVIPSWLESVSPVVLRFLCDLCLFFFKSCKCVLGRKFLDFHGMDNMHAR